MAVVFVLLAAGFLFTMNDGATPTGSLNGPKILEAHGVSLDQQEYSRMGDRTLQLASAAGLNNYVNFLMVPDIRQLEQLSRYGISYYNITRNNLTNEDLNRFITNRLTLQNAIADMGIYASEESVSETIKTSPSFSQDGKFNSEAYTNFIDQGIGNLGMTEKDLREIVRETICLQKLVDIIGGGLVAPKSAVRDLVEGQSQTVSFSRVSFSRASFLPQIKPSEEETKAYWESHQDAYKTEEKRRISYILLNSPAIADEPSEELPADASEEEKAAKKAADELAASEKAEKKAAAAKALNLEVQEISQIIDDTINDKLPFDFAKIVNDYGKELKSTELFTQGQLPAELNDFKTLRGQVNQGQTLDGEVFSISLETDEYSHISSPLPVGENAWLIFTVDEVAEPTLLDYETAKERARQDFISENADKAVKDAADEARTKILASMESGKGFADAAKELELQSVSVGPYSAAGIPPKDEPSHRQLLQTASGLNPGDVSEVIHENERSLFIHLDKREIEDTEQLQSQVDATDEGMQSQLKLLTFLNWLNQQYLEAEVGGRAAVVSE